MMRGRGAAGLLLTLALGLSPLGLTACTGTPTDDTAATTTETAGATEGATAAETAAAPEAPATLADGTYEIEVTTDSSMFRAAHCTLEVADGAMVAHLALPGEGFSRLFFGTAEEATAAAGTDGRDGGPIYDYHLGEDGLYTFDLPVEALDTDLACAAFGQRRDTWYDHTIAFASPAGDASGNE
jgi:hypothetical protein